ncbi:MAG: hypothetical protein ABIK93_07180 [candidate division WOR-3 bacterium]
MIIKLLLPIGIVSNLFMIFAVLTGLRWIKTKVKIHQLLALLGFFSAIFHAVIGIYITFFK